MASAVSRIRRSSILQANLFQLFQPICGVLARPSAFCAQLLPQTAAPSTMPNTSRATLLVFISIPLIVWMLALLHGPSGRGENRGDRRRVIVGTGGAVEQPARVIGVGAGVPIVG